VAQVGQDRAAPVDVRAPRPVDPGGPVDRPGQRGTGALGEAPLEVGDYGRDDGSGRPPAAFGHNPVEAEQGADQVHVGLDRVQQLRLQQQPGQVEPLDGVGLHDLDHCGRKVPADVAQPPRHPRGGRVETAAAPAAFAAPGRANVPVGVVERGQRGVRRRVPAAEAVAGALAVRRPAERHAPAAGPLLVW
jgi:hypothetical protein